MILLDRDVSDSVRYRAQMLFGTLGLLGHYLGRGPTYTFAVASLIASVYVWSSAHHHHHHHRLPSGDEEVAE